VLPLVVVTALLSHTSVALALASEITVCAGTASAGDEADLGATVVLALARVAVVVGATAPAGANLTLGRTVGRAASAGAQTGKALGVLATSRAGARLAWTPRVASALAVRADVRVAIRVSATKAMEADFAHCWTVEGAAAFLANTREALVVRVTHGCLRSAARWLHAVTSGCCQTTFQSCPEHSTVIRLTFTVASALLANQLIAATGRNNVHTTTTRSNKFASIPVADT